MRTQAEWNVDTHISRARPPTRAATRSFISPAALLVNVMAMIWSGLTPPAASRYAIRCVSTRVLPDPAPATMSSGEPRWTTAATARPAALSVPVRLATGSRQLSGFRRATLAWHTRRRDRAGAVLLFLRLRESGSRRSRLNERPTAALGSEARGGRASGVEEPGPTDEDETMTAITVDEPSSEAPAELSATDAQIAALRARIDEIDATIIALWQERAALSQQVGATRVASGGTRLVLAREREILDRFRSALGADGTQVALLLLRAGRGPL